MVSIALYQPDIPQNAGTILRLGACLGIPVHIIEPAEFVWSEKTLKRAGMYYLHQVDVKRHNSFANFQKSCANHRVVLLTTRGNQPYTDFSYQKSDILLLGRESAGVPHDVHAAADARIIIPMTRPHDP